MADLNPTVTYNVKVNIDPVVSAVEGLEKAVFALNDAYNNLIDATREADVTVEKEETN